MDKNNKKECNKSHPKIEFTENGNILTNINGTIAILKDGIISYKSNKENN